MKRRESPAARLMTAERLGPAVPFGQGKAEERSSLGKRRGLMIITVARLMAAGRLRQAVPLEREGPLSRARVERQRLLETAASRIVADEVVSSRE